MPAVSDYLLGLRHVGVVTEDLRGTVERLQQVFGIADGEILYLPDDPGIDADTRFAFFSIGGTPYEVIEPVSAYFRDILLSTNRGANHVCYNVTDLDAAIAAMAAQGVRLGHVTPDGIADMPGFRMAYFNPGDTAGVLIEFVESKNVN